MSLDVAEHECVGLVGESGSGKTTLARMLVGLERATAGTIAIDGIDASDWASLGRADLRRLRGTVQFVFQDPYSTWTRGEASDGRSPRRSPLVRRTNGTSAGWWASCSPRSGSRAPTPQRRPVALSGGMRQRVAIARALAAKPRLLVCDEPVSALDVSVQAQILNLLRRLHGDRGLGYLFITHDLSIVRQITDYLYVMHRGRVVESGPTEQVLDSPQHPYTVNLLTSVPRARRSWLTSGADPDHEAD